MRRSFRRWAIVVVAASAFVALPPVARAQKLEPVTMAMPSEGLAYSLSYIADAKGLWAKHGLDLHEVLIAGIGATNAVIAGSVELSHASGASLTRAAAHGQRLLAIVAVLDRASVEIVLRKDVAEAAGFDPQAPLAQRAKVLDGRTISIDAINSIDDIFLRVIAKRGGLGPDAVRLAVLKADNALAAIATKQIDGIAMSPPWPQSAMLANGAVLVASGLDGDPPDYVPLTTTVVLTKPETCAKRRVICEGVGQAMKDAAQIMHEQPAEAEAIIAKRLPTMDPKLIAAVLQKITKATPSPLAVTAKALENAERLNIESGLLKPEEKLPSYDGLFTDAYVK
ncbi:MAG TPA: ABC transporter substrate-binding protein [Stellaceae bacterium]|jgi:ABC-type nitrate/sulfonate/bicarbonate transport system substrate-binding protein|nr:ABC transporter substrate-binding protein [Stellaceae bacterium]